MLSSSKAVHEAAAVGAGWRRWTAPDPRLSPAVELAGSDLGGVVELGMVGEALAGKSFAAEQAPPGFLQIEPGGALGNEDLLYSRMRRQPFLNRRALMTREIVADH